MLALVLPANVSHCVSSFQRAQSRLTMGKTHRVDGPEAFSRRIRLGVEAYEQGYSSLLPPAP